MRQTIIFFSAVLCAFLICICSFSYAADAGTQFQRDQKIAAVKQYKPVKIKLKGDSSGKCSWELSGDNVKEILRADARIRRYVKSIRAEGEDGH
jgi:predicted secreted protein